jgi:hypothetical protein
MEHHGPQPKKAGFSKTLVFEGRSLVAKILSFAFTSALEEERTTERCASGNGSVACLKIGYNPRTRVIKRAWR